MLGELYQQAKEKLAALDVRLLMAHALDLSPEEFLLQSKRVLTSEEKEKIHALLAARASGKPVAKIIGRKEFYDLEFITTTDTLDPRPDSETLIEVILKKTDAEKPYRILDLGTGTGCLILTLLHHRPNASGVAVDRADAALDVALRNAKNLNLESRVIFTQSDWFEKIDGLFDIIISNPPYIPSHEIEELAVDVRAFDPMGALDGGDDGLDPYRTILDRAAGFMNVGGLIAFEVGHTQSAMVAEMLKNKGFHRIEALKDLSGIDRVVTGYRL